MEGENNVRYDIPMSEQKEYERDCQERRGKHFTKNKQPIYLNPCQINRPARDLAFYD